MQVQPADTPVIQRAPGSAVRSHQSYTPQVEGVCHHSGQYLARSEINPQQIALLREQHDFPGFKELDDLFARAFHAREHQHLIWSRPGLQGVALLIAGMLLLIADIPVWLRRNQWATLVEFVLVYAVAILGLLAGLALCAWGAWLLARRNAIYHRRFASDPLGMGDFPLFGSLLQIRLREHVQADMSNDAGGIVQPQHMHGTVDVDVYPEPMSVAHYAQYRERYGARGAGAFVHAGVIAFNNLQSVAFKQDNEQIEFGNRLVLRQPAARTFAPAGVAVAERVRFGATYELLGPALERGSGERRRFVLELSPEVEAYDSRTLVLRFCWHGERQTECRLVECRVKIEPELLPVSKVALGRTLVTNGDTEVIWRNLAFRDGELVLSVTFSHPILTSAWQPPLVLSGNYQFSCTSTISGLGVAREEIWNAMGRRAIERSEADISGEGVICGNLRINTALLSQEHEFVRGERLPTTHPLDHELVMHVAQVLADQRVVIQDIEQAAPRPDPSGRPETELLYWDIVGRRYEESVLEAIDVHVVITGVATNGQQPDGQAPAEIDLRVRCLHDPRNTKTPNYVQTTCDALMAELRRRIPAWSGGVT
jgi:hypothetical protein